MTTTDESPRLGRDAGTLLIACIEQALRADAWLELWEYHGRWTAQHITADEVSEASGATASEALLVLRTNARRDRSPLDGQIPLALADPRSSWHRELRTHADALVALAGRCVARGRSFEIARRDEEWVIVATTAHLDVVSVGHAQLADAIAALDDALA